ncbi:hypothetical protein BRAO375_3100004 [Bradyrhizobium sp. ORS 375]|nr:hypothetical protein BRAO375_3100004 [Bradyrhizobium sp. ORS 375]
MPRHKRASRDLLYFRSYETHSRTANPIVPEIATRFSGDIKFGKLMRTRRGVADASAAAAARLWRWNHKALQCGGAAAILIDRSRELRANRRRMF